MKKQLVLAAAALATLSAPAAAHPNGRAHGYHNRSAHARAYQAPRYYGERYRDARVCRDKGTGGTVIGAIAGGLAGRELLRRDRTAGTIGGAALGALAGRAIDRNCR
ncbi:MAG: hypothetical protein AVDCRST_MAG39-1440 [uncultured Sphingomonadaceae bacterium]|uniref:17 kDa surface antigen n=1 Tax=uncultured Sphingomonadaceae bacterium TaxID=169976 RepID=A0A6J4SLF0_9SPHN|nr:MAG: hypothetical protein AVDCRST_MAG39-1440 [uncultured Sphingomonadaceae bacterium]